MKRKNQMKSGFTRTPSIASPFIENPNKLEKSNLMGAILGIGATFLFFAYVAPIWPITPVVAKTIGFAGFIIGIIYSSTMLK